jgi:hypothetical protein
MESAYLNTTYVISNTFSMLDSRACKNAFIYNLIDTGLPVAGVTNVLTQINSHCVITLYVWVVCFLVTRRSLGY